MPETPPTFPETMEWEQEAALLARIAATDPDENAGGGGGGR